MKEKDKTTTIKVLVLIIFFLSFIGIVESITRFETGMHNLDTGQNIRYLESQTTLELVDIGSDYQIRTGDELYILGMNQTKEAFMMILFFTLIFGLSLASLIRGHLK